MSSTAISSSVYQWIDRNFLELGRQMRLSYLPPLMVYLAAGISGLTGIVGVFYVKERLGLSAEFLAALGFWGGLPWALKMPLGHLVDLIWRWKAVLVYIGASLIVCSLLIMVGLLGDTSAMTAIMPVEAWYVLAALLAPVGYVVQDVVADAMTVEAVPHLDDAGKPIPGEQLRLMHTTMQTLGRVAIIGGIVDALIVLVDTALESPLGQIAMIPMLAWIANSAPDRLKATFFAVMASFTNLALSAAQLGTKYLNMAFSVTREVKDTKTGLVTVPADYGELGMLLISATVIGFVVPMLAIWMVRMLRLRSA